MKIIDAVRIVNALENNGKPSPSQVHDILQKASEKRGLTLDESACLLNIEAQEFTTRVFETAGRVKDEIYGERLVFFAPLYISDFCVNDCAYCNFHVRNTKLLRKKLTTEEIKEQTRHIIDSGHKRILLECGEDLKNNTIDYVVNAIEAIYSVQTRKGNIRRINVNVAATTTENYRRLKEAHIGTYQLFQETYHEETFKKLHKGLKADYVRQLTAHERAFEAGIDDVGIGALFGLYKNWKFETLALISHANYLDKKYGVGPHTISVPRFQKAPTVDFMPRVEFSDTDFLKLIAVLRLSVPYTGIILSTREKAETRNAAFKVGVSQASAGSVAVTGGYGKNGSSQPQFEIHDRRTLHEVIKDILQEGLLPSFCTACYRKGRTGHNFMSLSKPGTIYTFCRPNGLLTFAEYLEDFAKHNGDYEKGKNVIERTVNKIEKKSLQDETRKRLVKIFQGERDLYF